MSEKYLDVNLTKTFEEGKIPPTLDTLFSALKERGFLVHPIVANNQGPFNIVHSASDYVILRNEHQERVQPHSCALFYSVCRENKA